jgi:hypothetical protein
VGLNPQGYNEGYQAFILPTKAGIFPLEACWAPRDLCVAYLVDGVLILTQHVVPLWGGGPLVRDFCLDAYPHQSIFSRFTPSSSISGSFNIRKFGGVTIDILPICANSQD